MKGCWILAAFDIKDRIPKWLLKVTVENVISEFMPSDWKEIFCKANIGVSFKMLAMFKQKKTGKVAKEKLPSFSG